MAFKLHIWILPVWILRRRRRSFIVRSRSPIGEAGKPALPLCPLKKIYAEVPTLWLFLARKLTGVAPQVMLVFKITPFCGRHVRYAKDVVARDFIFTQFRYWSTNGELHRETHESALLYMY